MYLVYIIMSEFVAAMKRKSAAFTAARAEADVIGGTDTDKADKHFKKLCTAINRDFKKVKRAHEAAEEQDDPKEKTQKQEERAALTGCAGPKRMAGRLRSRQRPAAKVHRNCE